MKRSFDKFRSRLDAIGLRADVEKRSLKLHVPLKALYEAQGRSPSIAAARGAVYSWLHKERGLGFHEIARLFDRAPSGVHRLIRGAER